MSDGYLPVNLTRLIGLLPALIALLLLAGAPERADAHGGEVRLIATAVTAPAGPHSGLTVPMIAVQIAAESQDMDGDAPLGTAPRGDVTPSRRGYHSVWLPPSRAGPSAVWRASSPPTGPPSP